jgi:hypothetical protein
MEKPEGKRPLGKPNREWDDNMRIDLREIGWEGADRIHLAQDGDQWLTCEHFNEPSGSTEGREFLD